MNLLQSLSIATKRATTPQNNEITRDALRGGQIKILNGQAVLYGSGTAELIRNSYLANGDLYSIIRYIVNKSLRAKFFNYEVKDEKALADYRLLKGPGVTEASLKEARKVHRKALVVTNQPQIEALLARPNPSQTFKAFAENAVAYKLLTGERFMQKIAGVSDLVRLYILPPTQMEVNGSDKYLEISGYTYTPSQTKFAPDELIFSKMFHPALDGYGSELRGLSPLRVLAMQIQKSNESILSGVKQYQNGGPPGILSLTDEQVPLTEEQARQYEDAIARKAGSRNRGRVNVTGMHAEWIKMGLSPVDLDMLESGVFDLRALCRGYGLDSKLFNDNASTFNNMEQARKAAIVDAVIPAVEDLGDDLNQAFEVFNVKGKKYYVDADVTHFPELAEDLDKVMDRMIKGPFTPNQILEAMHYEVREEPLMNEPWFDNARTPLSQFGAMSDGVENDGSYA